MAGDARRKSASMLAHIVQVSLSCFSKTMVPHFLADSEMDPFLGWRRHTFSFIWTRLKEILRDSLMIEVKPIWRMSIMWDQTTQDLSCICKIVPQTHLDSCLTKQLIAGSLGKKALSALWITHTCIWVHGHAPGQFEKKNAPEREWHY